MHFIRHKATLHYKLYTHQPSYKKPIYKRSLDSQHNIHEPEALNHCMLVGKYTMMWSHRSFHLNHYKEAFFRGIHIGIS